MTKTIARDLNGRDEKIIKSRSPLIEHIF